MKVLSYLGLFILFSSCRNIGDKDIFSPLSRSKTDSSSETDTIQTNDKDRASEDPIGVPGYSIFCNHENIAPEAIESKLNCTIVDAANNNVPNEEFETLPLWTHSLSDQRIAINQDSRNDDQTVVLNYTINEVVDNSGAILEGAMAATEVTAEFSIRNQEPTKIVRTSELTPTPPTTTSVEVPPGTDASYQVFAACFGVFTVSLQPESGAAFSAANRQPTFQGCDQIATAFNDKTVLDQGITPSEKTSAFNPQCNTNGDAIEMVLQLLDNGTRILLMPSINVCNQLRFVMNENID